MLRELIRLWRDSDEVLVEDQVPLRLGAIKIDSSSEHRTIWMRCGLKSKRLTVEVAWSTSSVQNVCEGNYVERSGWGAGSKRKHVLGARKIGFVRKRCHCSWKNELEGGGNFARVNEWHRVIWIRLCRFEQTPVVWFKGNLLRQGHLKRLDDQNEFWRQFSRLVSDTERFGLYTGRTRSASRWK